MNKIAIFPFAFRRGTSREIPFGYSFGWYFKDKTGEYCLVFGNAKTREKANETLKREMPDVELINLEYEPPNKHNKSKPLPEEK